MPSTRADVPQLAVPLVITDTGREAVVEQGTDEERAQHVEVACRVLRGTFDHDPAFGTSDQTFRQGGIDAARLAAELAECDPRPDTLRVIDQELDQAAALVSVRVSQED